MKDDKAESQSSDHNRTQDQALAEARIQIALLRYAVKTDAMAPRPEPTEKKKVRL